MAEAVLSSPSSSVRLNESGSFDLLCACATANPSPEQIASMGGAVRRLSFVVREPAPHERATSSEPGARTADSEQRTASSEPWNDFLRLAEHHGVLALVARNLVGYARGLLPEVEQSLQSAYAANLRRNLWFTAELLRIMQHFARLQVRALPLKGPVLAQTAYGDVGLRSFNDLDLLISAADFARAKQALAELGYRPSSELTPAVERLWLRTGYERSFDGTAGKNLVELQWNLAPYFFAIDCESGDFRFEDLLARAGQVALGATTIPCLSVEDSLLILCLHAAKHLWTRLIWVADIAETLRTQSIDFSLVVARAQALGMARILGVSLWLAEHLLAARVHAAARALWADDLEVRVLGEDYAARLACAATYDFESTDYFRRILKLRERPSDRLRYLWRLALTPGPGEVAAVALPETLFPLYRVVRIGRLLRKLI